MNSPAVVMPEPSTEFEAWKVNTRFDLINAKVRYRAQNGSLWWTMTKEPAAAFRLPDSLHRPAAKNVLRKLGA
jgi:hypothetical protein